MWQQLIFLIGGFILAAALLPSIFSEFKPNRKTSFVTGIVLLFYLLAFVSLGQYISAVGMVFSVILWMILFVQVTVKG